MSSKPKICSVVGARPQFVKAAVVSSELRKLFEETIVHTGQHYDDNLSGAFFQELDIPLPDHNLGVGSGSHGRQTGRMLSEMERVLVEGSPDLVVVYGDTNSTLAGALAAAKLHIPIAHVEAGLRSYRPGMPEEINRVLTDHISTYLFCPSRTAADNLEREGIIGKVFLVGDVMKDVLKKFLPVALAGEKIPSGKYSLLTIHREENTTDPGILSDIFNALSAGSRRILFPLHPRTKKVIFENSLDVPDNIKVLPPVSYLEMLGLEARAELVLTDSGGVQKEAYWLKVPCLTLREETEWVETLEGNWNVLVGHNVEKIQAALSRAPDREKYDDGLFGTGDAAEKISAILASNVV